MKGQLYRRDQPPTNEEALDLINAILKAKQKSKNMRDRRQGRLGHFSDGTTR